MGFLLSMWLPIVLSGVAVFVASSVIHMVLGYHKHDFTPVPDEEAARNAMRPLAIPPGDYVIPYAGSMEAMNSDEYKAKVSEGPVIFFTALRSEDMSSMGTQLTQWFGYCVFASAVAAYVAGFALAGGADYMGVFRITSVVAFCCYAMAHPQRSIWYKQKWGTTGRNMFDGLVYSLLTGGIFGWLVS